MNYIVIGRDHADAFERRQQQRAAHLEGAKKLKEEGKLLYAVALVEGGKMKGSVMVFDFSSEAEFNEWKKNEPYVTGNVWDSIEVSECAVPSLFS